MISGHVHDRLLVAIQATGRKWITRAELAKALGKRALNHSELHCLHALRREGVIDVQRHRRTKYIYATLFYRARLDK
jgi:hypothetical protein